MIKNAPGISALSDLKHNHLKNYWLDLGLVSKNK